MGGFGEQGPVVVVRLAVQAPGHGGRGEAVRPLPPPRCRRRGPANVAKFEFLGLLQDAVRDLRAPFRRRIRTRRAPTRSRARPGPSGPTGCRPARRRERATTRASTVQVEGPPTRRPWRCASSRGSGGRAARSRSRPPRARCMNATGPRAGSPTRAPASIRLRTRGERDAPRRGGLHQEIVRVLPVHEQHVVARFADLDEQAVAARTDRDGLEAEHAGQRERAAAGGARRHAHQPVGRAKLIASARTTLVVERAEDHAVGHQHPWRR